MTIKCSRCQTDNRIGRRFCAECGGALPSACAACGFANDPGELFCGGCGVRLEAESVGEGLARQEAERRHLTVMFCDMVGSTEMAEQLDPEDLREVILDYQAACIQVVERFDGFVARFMGDGLLVYFGHPRAHEDDADRAVRAGLEIAQAVSALNETGAHRSEVNYAGRVGIASGMVVVGDLIGEGASEEMAVVGATPNLAARLQGLAPSDGVVIADNTHALVRGLFDAESLGPQNVKGVSEPVLVWRVCRALDTESRFEASHTSSLIDLVGRDDELHQLRQCWAHIREGAGQCVLLSADPGLGKSRLVAALSEGLDHGESQVVRYQCSAHHTNSALFPFISRLERVAGFQHEDSIDQKLSKLEQLIHSGDSGEHTLALFASLLALPVGEAMQLPPMAPEEQKNFTFAALIGQMRSLAAYKPLLIVFEDAHWADPTSLELIKSAVTVISDHPVMLLVTARPQFQHHWGDLDHVRSLSLERLGRAESAELVRRTAGAVVIPPELQEQILDKSDGIPLYLEEITKTVLELGDLEQSPGALPQNISIPSTLQDSLLARLTNLSTTKEVAQLAAAIGREFSHDLIAAVADMPEADLSRALERLADAEIVHLQRSANAVVYTFKHALIQDAAYGSLLRAPRKELHARIARALERHYPERAQVEPELFAHHFALAGSPREAIGYWGQAGKQALMRAANREVQGHVTRALELVAALPESAERDAAELGLQILRGASCRAIHGFAAKETEAAFSRARELCDAVGDRRQLIDVLRGLYACYYIRGELERAKGQADGVLSIAEEAGDNSMIMAGQWMLGCIAFWQGRFPEAQERLQHSVDIYSASEQSARTLSAQIDPGLSAMIHLSWALWILGFPERAIAKNDKAIATARELAQPFGLAQALFWAASIRVCCGDYQGAEQFLPELKDVTQRYGITYLASCATLCEGQTLIARQDFAGGLQLVNQALTEFAAQEAGVGRPWAVSAPIEALARVGKAEDGLKMLEMAFASVLNNDERQWESELHRLRGESLLAMPQPDIAEVEACYQQAVEVASSQGALSLELRSVTSLARLFAGQGAKERALVSLKSIYGRFTEGFETADLVAARDLIESLDS
jgi:class 3 adenylate cyclase/tetratricopeptide (TPR) repeat protein